jgi:hypothetical protein
MTPHNAAEHDGLSGLLGVGMFINLQPAGYFFTSASGGQTLGPFKDMKTGLKDSFREFSGITPNDQEVEQASKAMRCALDCKREADERASASDEEGATVESNRYGGVEQFYFERSGARLGPFSLAQLDDPRVIAKISYGLCVDTKILQAEITRQRQGSSGFEECRGVELFNKQDPTKAVTCLWNVRADQKCLTITLDSHEFEVNFPSVAECEDLRSRLAPFVGRELRRVEINPDNGQFSIRALGKCMRHNHSTDCAESSRQSQINDEDDQVAQR